MNGQGSTSAKFSSITSVLERTTSALLAAMNEQGHWSGELSSSALSTAVATIALGELDRQSGANHHEQFVANGLRWLADHVNEDGGWGDTIRSQSNLSTTALVWAAFGAAGMDRDFESVVASAVNYIERTAGSLENVVPAIEAAYGKDRTFSVPIVMTLALSGRLGKNGWGQVRALPFELAMFPRSWFGALQLPVVSYALPALIAIGQTIHFHSPSKNPVARVVRDVSRNRTLQTLEQLQPANGGFLEATPLTAFVTMSLASMGLGGNAVARKGGEFLRQSVLADGSWPIDTNLATWVTTLSIKALAHQPDALSPTEKQTLREWLLKQQYQTVHPYTGAAPGGWAWTDLPGGVPDADDTAGALLALYELGEPDEATIRAVEAGARWLLDLQNRDGGIPTFCRGWGTLPFDRSTPEITVHALRAWTVWRAHLDAVLGRRLASAIPRALHFLSKAQRGDGAWIPLWFGNENAAAHENAVYGTAQVLISLNELIRRKVDIDAPMIERAAEFLLAAQGRDGGWGGDAGVQTSVEETALALEALADSPQYHSAVDRGVKWLLAKLDSADSLKAAPIGLYFARLWYFEQLYPLIFATSALGKLRSKQR
ncbi:squalene--hopene cyclase [bacterium]|nr:squalene--hopene cyclase [bacterium]